MISVPPRAANQFENISDEDARWWSLSAGNYATTTTKFPCRRGIELIRSRFRQEVIDADGRRGANSRKGT